VYCWRTSDFLPIRTVEGISAVWQVALSPDAPRLAWLNRDSLKVVERETGRSVEAYPNANPNIPAPTAFCFSPNGMMILLGTRTGIERYNTQSGIPDFDVREQRFDVGGGVTERLLCLDALGLSYASVRSGQRWEVRVYSEPYRPFQAFSNDSEVTALASDPQTGNLASGGSDGIVRVWTDLARPTPNRKDLRGPRQRIHAVAFSPDGKRLVSCSADQKVRVWDVETGTELLALGNWSGATTALSVGPKGHRLAIGVGQKVLVLGTNKE